MNETFFNIWVIFEAIGLVMGVFMTLMLILTRERYSSIHIHNITVVFFIMSMLLFFEIAEESNLVDRYPMLLGIGPLLDLLIWPFLLFYVQYIIGDRNGSDWPKILYFLPFVIGLIWQIPFLLLSNQDKLL